MVGTAGNAAAEGHEEHEDAGSDEGNADEGDDQTASPTRIRAAHMAPGAPAIDGETVLEGAEFTGVTEYAGLPPGIQQFGVAPSMADGQPLFRARGALGPGDYTAVALQDEDGSPVPMLLQGWIAGGSGGPPGWAAASDDDNGDDGTGDDEEPAYARFVHATADASAVTVETGGGSTRCSRTSSSPRPRSTLRFCRDRAP